MKHAFKKIMALVLTLAMILSILPSVFAANVGPFTDVKDDAWYADYVEYVYDYDLMNGVTGTTFDPNGNCTRAMAATVIYRLAGEPSVTEPATFTDLDPKMNWYKNSVAWAQDEGVVNGVTATTFVPNGLVTREQLVAMIWRYAGSPKATTDNLKDFPDAGQISNFAKDAFNWAISQKIIGGDNGKLVPKGNATRAQFAKIITVYNKLEPCTTHDWDAGVVTKEATCTETGIMTYTCKICGETKTEVIPVVAHAYVDGICTVCGDKLANDDEIVIYYTNDVHTYIDGALSYDNIADLKAQTAKVAKGVLLVDAGDHIQGTAFGSMDKGAKIVEMMNAAGYDAAAIGNHEFDYGMARALEIIEQADYDYLSANFYEEAAGVKGDNVTDAYKIYTIGGKKIAVIGITTPESFTKSTPKYFQDDAGNYIYGIAGGTDGAALYASVQAVIDAAKAENPDYIIALGHLGIDESSKPWTSKEVIANVSGLNAFIDGHSHSSVVSETVKDKSGKDVILTQTGSYFDAIGKMTIKGDTIKTELITSYGCADATTKGIKDAWIKSVNDQLGEKIGVAKVTLDNYDKDGNRLVRKQETNTGDFAADALYYLFDVTEGLDVDCAIMNGGGVRNKAVTGDISYLTCKSIHTFGNVACLQTVTGQQILDALEWGARDVGKAECGGFLQVSGIEYEIHSYITSTVQKDDKGVWTAGPTGEYRVKNVKIGGEPIDLAASYNLAGYNYTLRDLGDGFAMFKGAVNVKDYVMEDYMVLANFVKSFPVVSGLPTIPADGEYKDVNGAGRIKIVTEKPAVGEDYILSTSLKDGDKIVIVNKDSGMAMSNTVLASYYLAGTAVTPSDNKIVSPDASIVWDVKAVTGGFEISNGGNKLSMGAGTFHSIPLNDANATWELLPATTENCVYFNNTVRNEYLEWYADKTEFSAIGYRAANETLFAMQIYVLGGGGIVPPDPPIPSEDKIFEKVTSEPTDWEGTYIIVNEIDATSAAVFNGSADGDGNNVKATIADGKITASTDNAVVFEASGTGYTFKAAGGYMNGKGAGSNGLTFSATPAVGTLSWDAENGAIITAADGNIFRVNIGLQFNSETEYYDSWFRFFKPESSVKTPISLYKMTDETPVECVHALTATAAKAATCTEEGNIAYWTCSKCNKVFSDAAATTVITLASTVLEKIAHVDVNPQDDKCDVCGADLGTPAGGDYVLSSSLKDGDKIVIVNKDSGMAMSNTVLASYYLAGTAVTPSDNKIVSPDASIVWDVKAVTGGFEISNGGNKLSMGAGTFHSIPLNDANATWELLPATTENCVYFKNTVRGEYLEWYASKTEFSAFTYYADSEPLYAMQIYVLGGTVTPPCTHATLTPTAAKAADCTTAGNIAYWTCAECGKIFSDAAAATEITLANTAIAALGHIDANVDNKCDRCGEDMGGGSGTDYTLTDSIKAGDKIIIAASYSSKYYAFVKDNSAAEITVTDNKADSSNADAIWEVCAGSADGTFKLKNADGKYLSWTSSSAISYNDTGVDLTITYASSVWTIAVDASRSVALQEYQGSPRFRAYANSNASSATYSFAISFFKLG